MKKLISVTIILMATLQPFSLPAGAGKYTSYNTTWTMTCNGNVGGAVTLSNKSKAVGASAACFASGGIQSSASGTVNTFYTPTNWTWAASGCYDSKGGPLAAISGSVGSTKTFNCYPAGGAFAGSASTGSVGTNKPVGVQ